MARAGGSRGPRTTTKQQLADEIARSWVGKHRRKLVYDYDQAIFLIGACFENSGINANETLANENFTPHPALLPLLEWHFKNGATPETRSAAARACAIFRAWERSRAPRPTDKQLDLWTA